MTRRRSGPTEVRTRTTQTPTGAEFSVAFSPRQLAGGFAIIAALLVLLIRHRRGRRKG